MKIESAARAGIRSMSRMFAGAVALSLLTSCGVIGGTKQQAGGGAQPYCQYKAASAISRSALPQKVFFFPPLLCDSKGRPKQSLQPMMDAEGRVAGWSTPSETSGRILASLKKRMESAGYEVLAYGDVLEMTDPHSILVVSSFYSALTPVEKPQPGRPDRYVLTMLKVKTFDNDLNPNTAHNLCNLDGISFMNSASPVPEPEVRSMNVLIDYLGDNITGHVNL